MTWRIKARFASTCSNCGGKIARGETVLWSRETKHQVRHELCQLPDGPWSLDSAMLMWSENADTGEVRVWIQGLDEVAL